VIYRLKNEVVYVQSFSDCVFENTENTSGPDSDPFEHNKTLTRETVDAVNKRAHDIFGILMFADPVPAPEGMIAFYMQRAYYVISEYWAKYKNDIMHEMQ